MNALTSYIITIGDLSVTVTPKRRVKRLNLRVRSTGDVVMSTPASFAHARAEQFLRERESWIRSALEKVKESPENQAQRCQDGSQIQLFGETLRVVVAAGRRESRIQEGILTLGVPKGATEEQLALALRGQLRKRLLAYAEERMPLLCERVGAKPSSWYLRKMKTRWGTCNTRTGRICLNMNLVHYPPACIDYVIVHELCHLHVAGHTRAFWDRVEAVCPDYRQLKKRLHHK